MQLHFYCLKKDFKMSVFVSTRCFVFKNMCPEHFTKAAYFSSYVLVRYLWLVHQQETEGRKLQEPWKPALVVLCSAPSLTQGTWQEWKRWRTAPFLLLILVPVAVAPQGQMLAQTTSSMCGHNLTVVAQSTRTATGISVCLSRNIKRLEGMHNVLMIIVLFILCSDRGFTLASKAQPLGRYWKSMWWTWITKGNSTVRVWLLLYALCLARTVGKGFETDPHLR